MELIDQLTKSLGVTEDQAKGGAGMLFKHAKGNLGGRRLRQGSRGGAGG